MSSLTLKGVPEEVMDRLRTLADIERRSLNQQAILLLEHALAEEPLTFKTAYHRFREQHGPSPLQNGDVDDLRSADSGRVVDL